MGTASAGMELLHTHNLDRVAHLSSSFTQAKIKAESERVAESIS